MTNLLVRKCLVLTSGLKFKQLPHLRFCYPCSNISLPKLIGRGYTSIYENKVSLNKIQSQCIRYCSTKKEDEKKPTLFQKFKKMYKEYWYVLVPVHLVTSATWLGGFYYLSKSGVDLVAILEYLHFSEKFTNPLKDSSVGYIAIAYAMYKVATPLRYGVTLGGTTVLINYLRKWGYIKPVPSREQLKQMYQKKMESIKEKTTVLKEPKKKGIIGGIGVGEFEKMEEKTFIANVKDKKTKD